MITLFSAMTCAAGVLAGATIPVQLIASYPGKPGSATVGTEGRALTDDAEAP
jgi:hypothetical protein